MEIRELAQPTIPDTRPIIRGQITRVPWHLVQEVLGKIALEHNFSSYIAMLAMSVFVCSIRGGKREEDSVARLFVTDYERNSARRTHCRGYTSGEICSIRTMRAPE